jgi:hypothetical protein
MQDLRGNLPTSDIGGRRTILELSKATFSASSSG